MQVLLYEWIIIDHLWSYLSTGLDIYHGLPDSVAARTARFYWPPIFPDLLAASRYWEFYWTLITGGGTTLPARSFRFSDKIAGVSSSTRRLIAQSQHKRMALRDAYIVILEIKLLEYLIWNFLFIPQSHHTPDLVLAVPGLLWTKFSWPRTEPAPCDFCLDVWTRRVQIHAL